ncbi:MAG: NfeD family protein, partial [bacterium]
MEWLKPQIVWFVVGFIMILLEFAIPGIITVFFGLGAWLVALLCLFLDLSVNLQLLIFLVSSVSLLVFLRKWFKSLFLGHYATSAEEIENLEEYVGQKA